MTTRAFLSKLAKTGDLAFARYSNAVLPKRAAVPGGLEPFAGAWNRAQAMHLLRRTLFGFTQSDLDLALAKNLSDTVDALLTLPAEVPAPPLAVDAKETAVPIGQTWVDAANDGTLNNVRGQSLQAWWMGLILGQGFTIREKMTLFWHNHFANELKMVGDARYMHVQNTLLRLNALGNFKSLVKQITTDPAMLVYLNGDTNTKANPNENYGREVQELFTIGKGPEIAAGNYTNYTEEDVKTVARVLTGWTDVRATKTSTFRPLQHDAADKIFSAAYGNAVIMGRAGADGALELDDLVNLIFAQAETARFICRKIYRFFVYYAIDADTETNVIAPMADLLGKGGFEIKPVLAALFKSAHFHHALNQGCGIKTPIDLVAGSARLLQTPLPDAADVVKQYAVWKALQIEAADMQLELCMPPNVAGWPAYYQDPVFYEAWISSDTLPKRVQFTDKLGSAQGYKAGQNAVVCDVTALARRSGDPSKVDVLVGDLAALFFPVAVTAKQTTYLQDILLSGLPDYEWTAAWSAFDANPADANSRAAVETRLRALIQAMMEMAEFQLC